MKSCLPPSAALDGADVFVVFVVLAVLLVVDVLALLAADLLAELVVVVVVVVFVVVLLAVSVAEHPATNSVTAIRPPINTLSFIIGIPFYGRLKKFCSRTHRK